MVNKRTNIIIRNCWKCFICFFRRKKIPFVSIACYSSSMPLGYKHSPSLVSCNNNNHRLKTLSLQDIVSGHCSHDRGNEKEWSYFFVLLFFIFTVFFLILFYIFKEMRTFGEINLTFLSQGIQSKGRKKYRLQRKNRKYLGHICLLWN